MTAEPEEIREAVSLLEAFEKAADPVDEISSFSDGIDILNQFLEAQPDSPHARRAANLKRAHTRRFLARVPSLGHVDMDEWLQLLVPLLVKVPQEVRELRAEHPEFRASFKRFKLMYAEPFMRTLQEQDS